MRCRYKTQQWIPYPIELVFAFFANPHNLPSLMMKWQSVKLEEATLVPPPPRPVAPDPANRVRTVATGKGSSITLSFRPLPYSPVRLPWESTISEFVWNEAFTDLAVRSPFQYWEHRHSFEVETRANATGVLVQGTLVKDDVHYEPPGGGDTPMSHWFHKLVVHRMMSRTFHARQQKLTVILPRLLGQIVPVAVPTETSE